MNKATILVIDDEPQIRKMLAIILENSGYQVKFATSGNEGMLMAVSHQPDLILLDIGLPDKNGQEVLKDLRLWFQKAIIMLSVEAAESEIVMALDNGATDYLTKPFRTAELLARIRSAIRRNHTSNNESVICFQNLSIDLVGRVVKKDEEIIKITATEFNLLCLFVKNQGRVLTHQFILKEIWGVGSQTETQYLRVFVGTLRKKIEENPNRPKLIITESGIGYRFLESL